MAKDRGPAVPYVSDEGRSHERTELAWGRSGLAVMVAVGVLARRVWTLHGVPGVVGLIMVGIGALVYLVAFALAFVWAPLVLILAAVTALYYVFERVPLVDASTVEGDAPD